MSYSEQTGFRVHSNTGEVYCSASGNPIFGTMYKTLSQARRACDFLNEHERHRIHANIQWVVVPFTLTAGEALADE
jgi:hypothetical protein